MTCTGSLRMLFLRLCGNGVPVVAQRKRIQLGTMRLQVRSLALLSGLRIQHCHELWYTLQTWLGSPVLLWLWLWRRPAAVALIQSLAWEPPYTTNAAPKKKKKKKKRLCGKGAVIIQKCKLLLQVSKPKEARYLTLTKRCQFISLNICGT